MLSAFRRLNWVGAASIVAVAIAIAGASPPAFGQDADADVRIRKMESEIKALQRKVFPGGDERYFEPQITSGATGAQNVPAPSTSAVTDVLSRMDAIEAQLSRLTGQVEENSNRIRMLEEKAGIEASSPTSAVTSGTSAAALTNASISTPSPAPAPRSPAPAPAQATASAPKPAPSPTPAPQANLAAMSGGASAATAVASGPTSKRAEAVRVIEKPQTDDPADDEYSYGYRLWDGKFYPEAQQQLQIFADKYPKHWRASWGRNLLGRAYLDDGKPREAAKWFLQNYQADKAGGRAPDSLLYLAVSMKQLKDTKRACIALAEFSEAYAAEAAGRLKDLYDDTRKGLTCPN